MFETFRVLNSIKSSQTDSYIRWLKEMNISDTESCLHHGSDTIQTPSLPICYAFI